MENGDPDFIVVGEKVALGPLRRDLAAKYARWMNGSSVPSAKIARMRSARVSRLMARGL